MSSKMANLVRIGISLTDSCYPIVACPCRIFSTTNKPVFNKDSLANWALSAMVKIGSSYFLSSGCGYVSMVTVTDLALTASRSSNMGLRSVILMEITIIWDFLFEDHFKSCCVLIFVLVLRITMILGLFTLQRSFFC